MDLLCSAYGAATSDDDDDEEEARLRQVERSNKHQDHDHLLPPAKRQRSEGHSYPQQLPIQQMNHHHQRRPFVCTFSAAIEAPPAAAAPGRYVSKRELALLAAQSSSTASDTLPVPPPPPSTVVTSPVVGSISDSDIPSDVLINLKSWKMPLAENSRTTGRLSISLNGHRKAVNSLQWSESHAHLLASAGMDETVQVWNVWSRNQQKARIFNYHNGAVKDVRWSPQGFCLLSCGYDCSSRLVDVEKGTETQIFKEDQTVEVIKFHPGNSNLFLSGGSKGFLRLWDLRVGKVVEQYIRGLGPILDLEFSLDGKHFISSSDTSKSRISENSIIVWDVSRQVPLSNQVYTEAYTCTCIRYHPSDACFVAQSNGNYIAIFSARAPFKMDRYKRYEKHGVWGFPIKCNFNWDGRELASGSADGCVYFYDYRSSELMQKIKAFDQPCIDVAFHPVMPNVIASCSWTGEVSVFG